ncbi:Cyclin-G-associated kinase [Fasciolopsis buskii]|uniref:Cyclin-G-associated kinase n=1 Tax=Fasciolopsis buskii TaxID=27845 RepID=A0A8E0RZR8_9TREM|nr:Cyclin-G-associated kinase [Fasciolopsis buski]
MSLLYPPTHLLILLAHPITLSTAVLSFPSLHAVGCVGVLQALGCVLFYLTCTFHPFEESAKLAILNAKYNLPSGTSEHTAFHGLIRQMLLLDPRQRPTVTEVLGELSELASMREIRVSGPVSFLVELHKRRGGLTTATSKPVPSTPSTPQTHPQQYHHPVNGSKLDLPESANRSAPTIPPDRPGPPPHRPVTPARPAQAPPPVPSTIHAPAASVFANTHAAPAAALDSSRAENSTAPGFGISSGQTSSGSMLGMLKGGAGNLFGKLRDASTKVIEQVSASLTTDLDFQLITSRIAVMPYPGEGGLETLGSSNSIEEVQAMLNARYPGSYAVYNLSPRTYRSDRWFDGRVSHRVFEPNRAPALRSLLELCLNARLWLSQKKENICVIHCIDGRALSAILVCSLLCFCRLFDNVSPALQLFSSKRGNPHLSPSQIRYIEYVAQLAHGRISAPHQRPLKLIKLTVAPVPTFNKSKNGCRPYVEVYEGKNRVLSTFADYETLKSYVLEDGKFELLLNGVSVMGDLTVIASVKIAQFQLYTGFLEPEQSELIYFKSDLDCLDTNSGFGSFTSRYAESFNVTIEFMVSPKERPRQGNTAAYPWETMPAPSALRPDLCVSSDQELHALLADFGRFNIIRTESKRAPPPRPKSDSRTAESTADSSINKTVSPDASHPLVSDLSSSGKPDVNTEDHVEPTERCPDAESSRPGVSSRPGKVASGVWTTGESLSSVMDHVEDSTPVADLLGFHSGIPESANRSTPTPPQSSDQAARIPSVLIDVDVGGITATTTTTTSSANLMTNTIPDVSALVDDFFNMGTNVTSCATSGAAATSSIDTNWAAAFDIPTTTITTATTNTSSAKSSNPFDLFSEATNSVLDDFAAAPTPQAASTAPSVPTTDKVNGTPADSVRFNAWWTEPGPGYMSSSASATNLAAGPAASPLFTSASCTNLTPPPAVSTSTTTSNNADPFADLTDMFGRPAETGRTRPSASAAGGTAAAVPGGFSAGPSPLHRPTSTVGQPHSSWSDFASNSSGPGPAPTPSHGARPQMEKDAFSDLLNDFSESASWQTHSDSQGPAKSINQMRREQLAKTTDPEQLKWQNTENEKLARMIFVELNDAMTEFEKDPGSAMAL